MPACIPAALTSPEANPRSETEVSHFDRQSLCLGQQWNILTMDEVQVLKTGCLKAHLLACLLALFVSGCAMAPATHGATPRIRQRGAEIIIIKDGRTHYFENRLPHCLAYTLAGEWEFAIQEAALRTPDRRHFVGLSVFATDTLPGPEGDPVSRAIAYSQAEVEK